MARRKLADSEIITALMTAGTVTEAAKLLGVSRQTIYNRLASEEFDSKLREAQAERDRQLEKIRESATVAALGCLQAIMEDRTFWTSDQDRIQAARTVLQFAGPKNG